MDLTTIQKCFHIFKKGGKRFLFGKYTATALELDDLAYDLLKRYKKFKKPRIIHELKGRYSIDQIEESINEICELEAKQLLTWNESEIDLQGNEQNLEDIQPSSIILDVSQKCNLRCKYCYANGDGTYGENKSFMPKKVAVQAVELLISRSKGRKKNNVTFFGGEPLLNFNLIKEVIEYCNKRGEQIGKNFTFGITTNGTLINDEIITYFKKHKIKVMVSIDGPKEIHDSLRCFENEEGTYEIIKFNTDKLVAAGMAITARGTLTRHTDKIEEIVRNSEKLGFQKLYLTPVHSIKNKEDHFSFCKEDLQNLLKVYEKIGKEIIVKLNSGEKILFNPFEKIFSIFKKRGRVKLGCGAGLSVTTVSTSGELYPCHRFVGMDKFIIGTVEKGIDYKKLRQFFKNANDARQKCINCWARSICGGSCYHQSANFDGTFNEPEKEWCDYIKGLFEVTIYICAMVCDEKNNQSGRLISSKS